MGYLPGSLLHNTFLLLFFYDCFRPVLVGFDFSHLLHITTKTMLGLPLFVVDCSVLGPTQTMTYYALLLL
jgi:hypothetical protein